MKNKNEVKEEKSQPDKCPVDTIVNRLWVLTYEDDGPSGICGQSCSITSSWRKVYLFESERKMREFAEKIYQSQGRLNARVVATYYPDPYAMHEVNFISDQLGDCCGRAV